jgi:hypothetical protein
MTARTRTRAASVSVAALLPTALLSGCDVPLIGDERSVESFCDTYWEQKDEYLTKYAERDEAIDAAGEEDPLLGVLAGLGTSMEALGDVVIIFDKLAKVAPDDIEPDVVAIRESLQKSIDNAGEAASNPLGALVGGLTSGLTTMGSWQRLSDYVVENCGEQA